MNPKERYEELADFLVFRHDFVELSQMMGMPCVKARGKMVAGFSKSEGAMVFKLPDPDARARALALDGAHLFDPSGKNQPFKEWVAVPAAHGDQWEPFVQEGLRP